MDVLALKEFLSPGLARVNACMDQALGSDIALLESTNHSLRGNPGKMLRPMLALLCAGAVGTPTPDTYRYAAAAELLHNATLLHDDVVDGARERRGRPTVASLLGGTASVLLGDYWLVKCLNLVLASERDHNRVLRLFSDTLGHLAEGEILQLEKSAAGDTTQEDYLRILYGKTASLFESAAISAVLSVGGSPEAEKALGSYAVNLGIAFQIRDDIFDYASGAAEIGKPVGIDLREGKITQPLLCALEEVSGEEAARLRALVSTLPKDPSRSGEVLEFVRLHGGVEKAARKMDFYVGKAIGALETLSDSAEKLYLAQLARFVAERNA